jgi:hypothetical protein
MVDVARSGAKQRTFGDGCDAPLSQRHFSTSRIPTLPLLLTFPWDITALVATTLHHACIAGLMSPRLLQTVTSAEFLAGCCAIDPATPHAAPWLVQRCSCVSHLSLVCSL